MLWEDIITWLSTAKRSDILDYAKSLPEDFFEAQRFVADSLCAALTDRAADSLRQLVGAHEPSLPSVPARYGLVDLLDYAALAKPDDPSPFGAWANQLLATWDGMFYLLTAKDYLEGKLFVDSCFKTGKFGTALDDIMAKLGSVYSNMVSDFSVENYEEHVDTLDRVRACSDVLGLYGFFPPNTIELYANLDLGEEKLELFRRLTDATVYANATQDPTKLAPEGYWRFLRLRLELDTVARLQPTTPADPATVQFVEQLASVMTTDNLLSGQLLATVNGYYPALGVAEKKRFQKIFRNLILENTELQVLCEPLNLDAFMLALERNSFEGTKREFIERNRVRVLPEHWQYAQKLLEVLAVVF